jgi:hypothetical protein
MPFTVIDLAASGWERGEREPGGDESKRWFIPPDGSPHAGRKWLFKPRRAKELPRSRAREQRGDPPDVPSAVTIGRRRSRTKWRSW